MINYHKPDTLKSRQCSAGGCLGDCVIAGLQCLHHSGPLSGAMADEHVHGVHGLASWGCQPHDGLLDVPLFGQ